LKIESVHAKLNQFFSYSNFFLKNLCNYLTDFVEQIFKWMVDSYFLNVYQFVYYYHNLWHSWPLRPKFVSKFSDFSIFIKFGHFLKETNLRWPSFLVFSKPILTSKQPHHSSATPSQHSFIQISPKRKHIISRRATQHKKKQGIKIFIT
jgi:hypothetical protein